MKNILLLTLIGLLGYPPGASLRGEGKPHFSLTITPRSKKVLAFHDVDLEITLTNTANRIITFRALPPERAYTALVLGPDGRAAELTNVGAMIMKNAAEGDKIPDSPYLDMRGYLEVTLLPHQVFRDAYPLSEIFDMTTPGVYSVRLRRRIPPALGGEEVDSNRSTVTVSYNPAAEKYGRYK